MKTKLTIILLLCFFAVVFAQERRQITNCQFNGRALYGRVRIVTHHADFRVQIVSHNPDLRVQKVDNFPNRCGRWQIVDVFPDFTIQIVTHNPDFTIQIVDNFPSARER